MTLLRTIILLGVIGCLSACDSGELGDSTLGKYVLSGGLDTNQEAETLSVPAQNCFVKGPNSRNWRLETGELNFDDNEQFEFNYIAQLYPYDTTTPDTFRVAGTYERHGPILRLWPTGTDSPNWFATAGPNSERPTTLVLGDYGPEGEIIQRNGTCSHLVLVAPGAHPDRSVGSRPNYGLFTLYGLVTDNGSRRLLLPLIEFGRLANNSYHGGNLEFLRDGTYKFSLDRTYGDDYLPDYTQRTVRITTGPYVTSGPIYALDPGTGRMSFAVDKGDSLYVYRNYVSSYYWSLDFYTSADLVFRRE